MLVHESGRGGLKKRPAAARAVVHSRIMAEKRKVEIEVRMAAEGEAGCPVKMGFIDNSMRCGRKLHIALDGMDEGHVCLMHSKDFNKQFGPLFDEFWREFERILKDAGDGEAHFERFIFPKLDFKKRKFQAICRFDGATFTHEANFDGAIFAQDVRFDTATFTQQADFNNAIFTQEANFWETTFTQEADFHHVTFTQNANFWDATFTQDANFYGATFMQNAKFWNTTFMQNAIFIEARFMQDADFHDTTFTQNTVFVAATFTQSADFTDTKFHETVDWRLSQFLDRAEFRKTKLEPSNNEKPSAVFALAKFSKPGDVVFNDVDLDRALFHDCDVSQFIFTSSVRWGRRKGNRGLAIFEETIDLKNEFAKGLKRDGQRDYNAIKQIYQQLKKNYDSRLDYGTANEFHFGEMEMKRLAVPTAGRLLWLRQWWHPRLSFVALYRWASDYGNSYRKPLAWLAFFLLLFAVVFPLPGVVRQGETKAESYVSRWDFQKGYGENLWAEMDMFANGLIASVDAAEFQRSPKVEPARRVGWLMARFETVLTSSLFALFLLAMRRQFRR